MDVLQRALRTQQSSDELVDVLHLVPPLSPRLLSMDLTTAMNGTTNAQYQRLLQAYAAYAKLIGTATELPNDAISLARVADAALEICAGFNYAFDHAWMLPLAKRVFTFSVEVAVRCDALYDAEMVKEGTGASLAHPEKIKAVCVLLDALRAKMMDRGQFPNTRKAGILFTLNLIFRCYLRLNNMKQMQKVLDYVFTHVLPDQRHAPEGGLLVKWFPRSERATYHFCMGKFLLMQHNVPEALDHLEKANRLCPQSCAKNKRHISVYWIVANMVDGRLPSPSAPIWSTDPAQYILFRPLITALSKGTIAAFHTALDARRVFWSKRGLYDLMRTRLEMILARNLARRVFMVGSGVMGSSTFGYDEVGKVAAAASGNEMQEGGGGVGDAAMQDDVGATTIRAPPRISLDDMCVAWRLAGDESFTEVDDQENQSDLGKYFGWPTQAQVLTAPTAGIQAPSVTLIHQLLSITALITRLIDCGYLKGYINANNRCVVVSRKQPFPPPSSVARRVMERERWWAPQLMDRGIVERGGDDEDDD